MVTSLWKVRYSAKNPDLGVHSSREVFVAADTFSKASLLAVDFCKTLPAVADASVLSVSDMGAAIFLEEIGN